MYWLQSRTHFLLNESPPVSAAYGDVTVREVGLGMTPQSVSMQDTFLSCDQCSPAQPEPDTTAEPPLQPLLSRRQLTHMSSAVAEPATKTGRQQELGIAGLNYDSKFNFFVVVVLLAKL